MRLYVALVCSQLVLSACVLSGCGGEIIDDSYEQEPLGTESCDGDTVLGYCFRSIPSPSISCSALFEPIDSDNSCQATEIGRPAVQFKKDCENDVDCVDSQYGPICASGLCTHWGACSISSECPSNEPPIDCHEVGLCALVVQ
jgi:hypothetical protein